ncbi:RNA polymerase sigma factor 54 interaction domain protein [Acididesulfobacillus acetoxydans]|uniref:HTH-type transcriptional regulatory protein TyrR n=1 Tax=Acididesulfobacillus acetoxydans TaxID=1561005 RepID=A0A8S0WX87_9FIRM|nr:sigma 54-interacting transcriptional regulator [Acididesulfobacillus acetoxydans]CAA7600811.1 RNA polymerase sigma factor 54 interaction domain protein [Acididesulfobacillus acetoxydans]CEJ07190.1 Hydrogenase-4 transcriptional activator [Acididesulfobacillus acetoxydans]
MSYLELCSGFLDDLLDILMRLLKKLIDIEEANRDLESIFLNSYDGISIVNNKGITIRVNPAMERLTGVKKEEVIGKDMRQLVENGVFIDSVSLRVLENKRPTTIIQKGRTGKQTIMTGTPIMDGNERIKNVVINIRDVTELYSLNEKLQRTMELTNRYQCEINELRRQVIEQNDIVAESKEMQEIVDLALRVAKVDSTVLLLGESGVGKEVLTKIIHKSSSRFQSGSFIKINSGAIPASLLESELFGYEEGAFTGAKKKGKLGMFQLATKGTLFLDEISELPPELQVKLLRVIQEKEFIPLGGTVPVTVDVRIIAATNKNLKKMVEEGKFREDLFYRLNVVSIEIPPLRKRREDIPALIFHFSREINDRYGFKKQFTAEALKQLIRYDWPGNVRQLANIIERSFITSKGDRIGKDELSGELTEEKLFQFDFGNIIPLNEAVELLERSLIKKALEKYKTTYEVAKVLKVSQATVARKAKKYRDEESSMP